MDELGKRRPLKSRGQWWSKWILNMLLKTSLAPNQISLASVGFAFLAAFGFLLAGKLSSSGFLVVAILGMQGRLLCNLMDGMVAVEGSRGTKAGEIFNELPDRASDIIIILGAGYAYSDFISYSPILGWTATLLAVLTAYIRVFGASVGVGALFIGPMAKPHRMALLTVACVIEILTPKTFYVIPYSLLIMIIGCIITLHRRTSIIYNYLTNK